MSNQPKYLREVMGENDGHIPVPTIKPAPRPTNLPKSAKKLVQAGLVSEQDARRALEEENKPKLLLEG